MDKNNVDFYTVYAKENKDPRAKFDYEIVVDFMYKRVKDIVVKGGEFAGFWNGERWSLSMDDLIDNIDHTIYTEYNRIRTEEPGAKIKVSYMNYESSGIMLKFLNYCKKQSLSDVQFNSKILFSDYITKREDYSTYQLPYRPEKGPTPAFDELSLVLYDKKELDKILWGMGALFTGDIKKIEKFLYLYGPKGTGKGTILKIIKTLVGEYWAAIDLQAITGSSEFATADIREVPMLIDSDSDISKITKEQNLLKLTSHEEVLIRKLYKPAYPVTFNGLLITASNERYAVKNIDAGITRRALVVHPTGKKVPRSVYQSLMNKIAFEIPFIADKCISRYLELGIDYYDDDIDVEMVAYSDKMFDFVREHYLLLENGVSLKVATELYKEYLEDFGWSTVGAKKHVKTGLQKYFDKYIEDTVEDGERIKNVFRGFKYDVAFPDKAVKHEDIKTDECEIKIDEIKLDVDKPGVFEDLCKDYPAQLTNEKGFPLQKWENVTTTMKDIDPTKLHFVRVPLEHIVIDFDLKNEKGEKDLKLNLEAASKYPPTYTEVSKSGKGIHLHYHYTGIVSSLANEIEPNIEIKVFSGKSALRRMFTKSNGKDVARISSGLPMKEKDVKMFNEIEHMVWTEKKLRSFIAKALRKEHHSSTTSEINFMSHVLERAQDSGVEYDISDLFDVVYGFAMRSTNQSEYCMRKVSEMCFSTLKEETIETNFNSGVVIIPDEDLYFFDVEVFPNVSMVCYKKYNFDMSPYVTFSKKKLPTESEKVIFNAWAEQNKEFCGSFINPKPPQIEWLLGKPLIGFNNRKYDNHILYKMLLGAEPIEIYKLSQDIIIHNTGTMGGAYNISYMDLYEMMDVKKSLKKWQIELGIPHDEFEYPWDKPLDQNLWIRCCSYCMNDVISTEEVFKSKFGQQAYIARKILCQLTNMPVNTKTQTLAAKFLFDNDKEPNKKFNWYDLSKDFPGYTFDKFRKPKSDYLGKDPSEGGYVSSKPGIYENVIYIDVASMHPHSLIAMNYFGPYTPKFKALVDSRIDIKHGNLEEAAHRFDNIDKSLSQKLEPFLQDASIADGLGHAMKIVVNIIYGMTSAPYDNVFKDPRNIDNCIAKRGALFMIAFEDAMTKRNVDVVHVKTDSAKLVGWSDDDIDFAMDFAKKYGYTFEIETIYKRMALVNKSTLIGETKDGEWEAVGAQFKDPYVYKRLFSKEKVEEADFARLWNVTSTLYLGNRFIGKNGEFYASVSGQPLYSARDDNISQKIYVRMSKPVDKYLLVREREGLDAAGLARAKVSKIARELEIDEQLVEDIIASNYQEYIVEKKTAATGTTGYLWNLWSEYKGPEDVDMGYYHSLVNDAVDDIFAVGDGNLFFKGTQWER